MSTNFYLPDNLNQENRSIVASCARSCEDTYDFTFPQVKGRFFSLVKIMLICFNTPPSDDIYYLISLIGTQTTLGIE